MSGLDPQCPGLLLPGLMQLCLRIHFRTAPQMHIPGIAILPPGGHPVEVRPSAFFRAFDLLQLPDGEILQPIQVLKGLCFFP
jgi:hypothetical protein